MLGHKDAAMTLNSYAGFFEHDLDRLAERVNEAVSLAEGDLSRTKQVSSALSAVPPRKSRASDLR
jgi:hypothetical protein